MTNEDGSTSTDPRRSQAVYGPVEASVREDLGALDIPPGRAGLAAAAIALAQKLDGDAGMAAAAVARELRATLAALTEGEAKPTDEFDQWLKRLSTPLRDSEV